jgi:hypothetical protein
MVNLARECPMNPEWLRCYRNALGNWHVTDYLRFTEVAERWLRAKPPGYSLKEFGRLLHEFVEGGGEIDQQRETRPGWKLHEYHYDLRVPIAGRLIYVETRLFYDDPDDPWIHVVNIHDA